MSTPFLVPGLERPPAWADPRHESLIDIPHLPGGVGLFTVWPEWSVIPICEFNPYKRPDAHVPAPEEIKRPFPFMEDPFKKRSKETYHDHIAEQQRWNETNHAGMNRSNRRMTQSVVQTIRNRQKEMGQPGKLRKNNAHTIY